MFAWHERILMFFGVVYLIELVGQATTCWRTWNSPIPEDGKRLSRFVLKVAGLALAAWYLSL